MPFHDFGDLGYFPIFLLFYTRFRCFLTFSMHLQGHGHGLDVQIEDGVDIHQWCEEKVYSYGIEASAEPRQGSHALSMQ